MMVEENTGGLGEEEVVPANTGGRFALFGRQQITEELALEDGVDLFAAGSAAFDTRMQSITEHFLLKTDLVQHIDINF